MPRLIKIFTLSFAVLITGIFSWRYTRTADSFHGDALGYYLYLPSAFIYHNLDAPDSVAGEANISPGIRWYLDQQKQNVTPTGRHLVQYTYGVALMELPFFLAAHGYSKMCGGTANGYTGAYNSMLKLCGFFYVLLGLLALYRVLLNYFSKAVSLFTVLLIFLGTNLFWFSIFQSGMAHVFLFFLYAALLLSTIVVHQSPSVRNFIFLGFIIGLITVIRPVDVICILIPLGFSVYNKQTLAEKWIFLKENRVKLAIAACAFILPLLPQLAYWKMMTGHWIYYSYGSQGFNWAHPKIKEGLFYFFNGWFPYTPVMAFSIIGLLFFRRMRPWMSTICILLPAYIYIIYSWYCYNYINGLGSRPMIHMYPLLAIPLAALIEYIARANVAIKGAFLLVICFFTALNFSYSVQQQKGILASDESNMAYNYQILFRSTLRYKDLVTRDLAERQPDTTRLANMGILLEHAFKDSLSLKFIRDSATDRFVYCMDTEQYLMVDSIVYDAKKFAGATWLKCSGGFRYTECPGYYKHKLVLEVPGKTLKICKIDNKIYKPSDTARGAFGLEHCQVSLWGTVYFFTKVPKGIVTGDKVRVYVWNEAGTELFVDGIRLEAYRPK